MMLYCYISPNTKWILELTILLDHISGERLHRPQLERMEQEPPFETRRSNIRFHRVRKVRKPSGMASRGSAPV